MNPFINHYGDQVWVDSNNSLHRENGPAVTKNNKNQQWWVGNKHYGGNSSHLIGDQVPIFKPVYDYNKIWGINEFPKV